MTEASFLVSFLPLSGAHRPFKCYVVSICAMLCMCVVSLQHLRVCSLVGLRACGTRPLLPVYMPKPPYHEKEKDDPASIYTRWNRAPRPLVSVDKSKQANNPPPMINLGGMKYMYIPSPRYQIALIIIVTYHYIVLERTDDREHYRTLFGCGVVYIGSWAGWTLGLAPCACRWYGSGK